MWKQCNILQQWETNHGVVYARELKGHQNKTPVSHFLRNHLTECAELLKWYRSLAQASFPLEGVLLIYCHHLCEEPTPGQRREALMQVMRSGKYCCRSAAFPCPLHVREKYTMGTNCSWSEKICNRSNFTCRGIFLALMTQRKDFIFVASLSINAIYV